LRAGDQPVWRDPATRYVRRAVSPAGGALPVDLTRISLPPGARVDYPPIPAIEQWVYLLAGRLTFAVGDWAVVLEPGDCARVRLDGPNHLANPGAEPADYLVVVGKLL
jgi:uncharacterized cupin superfamily protein